MHVCIASSACVVSRFSPHVCTLIAACHARSTSLLGKDSGGEALQQEPPPPMPGLQCSIVAQWHSDKGCAMNPEELADAAAELSARASAILDRAASQASEAAGHEQEQVHAGPAPVAAAEASTEVASSSSGFAGPLPPLDKVPANLEELILQELRDSLNEILGISRYYWMPSRLYLELQPWRRPQWRLRRRRCETLLCLGHFRRGCGSEGKGFAAPSPQEARP